MFHKYEFFFEISDYAQARIETFFFENFCQFSGLINSMMFADRDDRVWWLKSWLVLESHRSGADLVVEGWLCGRLVSRCNIDTVPAVICHEAPGRAADKINSSLHQHHQHQKR